MADGEHASAWAQRLATSRQQVHQRASETPWAGQLQRQVDAACRALWALIEGAVAEANNALDSLGPDECLSFQHTDSKGRVSIGKGLEARTLDVVVTPRVVDGSVSGGAMITTSQTRASIPLALVHDGPGEGLRWVVLTTLEPVVPAVIQTMFLFAFGDDAHASMEIGNYFSSA